MNVTKYNKMCDAELEIISGGGKVGAVIGGCLGGMLMAWAAGPVLNCTPKVRQKKSNF